MAPQLWICPTHQDIREYHPGKCPECGMELVPALAEPPPL